jgi:hypothetical protein
MVCYYIFTTTEKETNMNMWCAVRYNLGVGLGPDNIQFLGVFSTAYVAKETLMNKLESCSYNRGNIEQFTSGDGTTIDFQYVNGRMDNTVGKVFSVQLDIEVNECF